MTAGAALAYYVLSHKQLSITATCSVIAYGILHALFFASAAWRATTLALLFLYLLYYWLYVVQTPLLHCQQSFRVFLRRHCPTVFQTYYPTVWVAGGIARTLARTFIQQRMPVNFNREVVTLSDGGVLCLDWVQPDDGVKRDGNRLVLFLPGLTGGSDDNYARMPCHIANQLGYTTVVMNYRGYGVPLKTPMLYSAANTDDLCAVLSLVRQRFPKSSIFLMGVSLGGVLVTQYLCKVSERGYESGIVGALSVSAPYDCFITKEQLELPASRVAINSPLTSIRVELFKRNIDVFTQVADELCYDVDSICKSRTLTEFDERLIAPMFGYKKWQDYYSEACTRDRLPQIKVPYLAMNAGDDPFAPDFSLPVDQFRVSPYTAMIETTAGGHIGFTDALWPSGPTLVDKVFTEYSRACFTHKMETI